MMKLSGHNILEVGWFDGEFYPSAIFVNILGRSAGTPSSQPNFNRHRSWKIFLPIRMKGATKPRRLKTEPTTDRMPLRVGALGLRLTSKPNVLSSVFHCTPSARSTGNSSFWKSSLLISLPWSFPGILSRTSRLLLTHFAGEVKASLVGGCINHGRALKHPWLTGETSSCHQHKRSAWFYLSHHRRSAGHCHWLFSGGHNLSRLVKTQLQIDARSFDTLLVRVINRCLATIRGKEINGHIQEF